MRLKGLIRFFTARLWPAMVAIVIIGFAVRIMLLSLSPIQPDERAEPINLAISLLEKGAYTDPYGGPTGPSAHCMPLHPLISALVIRIFGLGQSGSRALSYFASCAASLGYALLPLLAVNCGLRKRVGVAAGLFGALLPVNFWGQTSGVFDAPYTFLTLVLLACFVGAHLRAESFTLGESVATGSVAAVSVLLNPVVLPILALWFVCGWIYFSRERKDLLRYGAGVCLIVFAALLPWALRNKAQLGRLIFTRANFGLELQISNNAVATGDLEANIRNVKWMRLHPFTNEEQRERVRRLGEVNYNRVKLDEAFGWIQANPGRFVRLTLSRIALFCVPRMLSAANSDSGVHHDSCCLWRISLWRTDSLTTVFLGSACVAYSLVYMVIEVSPRYRFPIEGFLLLFGSYFVCEVALGRRSHQPS